MKPPFVNVTIPVFNEERVLAENVGKVVKFLKTRCRLSYEIVIANNGSTDSTQTVAEELGRQSSDIRVVSLPEPGRGRTLKKVWSESTAGILSYMDVDLSTDLSAFPSLIESVSSGGFDIAIGSRRITGSIVRRDPKREFLSWGYHVLARTLFRTKVSDLQCGFKAITRKAAAELLPLVEDDGWLMDTELLVLAEKLGYRICELPVRWAESADSRVRIGSAAWDSLQGLMRLRRNLGRITPGKSRRA